MTNCLYCVCCNIEELKLWKPNGEDWKPKKEIEFQLLTQLEEDLSAERQSEHFVMSSNVCAWSLLLIVVGFLYSLCFLVPEFSKFG